MFGGRYRGAAVRCISAARTRQSDQCIRNARQKTWIGNASSVLYPRPMNRYLRERLLQRPARQRQAGPNRARARGRRMTWTPGDVVVAEQRGRQPVTHRPAAAPPTTARQRDAPSATAAHRNAHYERFVRYLARNCEGDCPVQRLKARLNALGSE
jgi:hypothetical protein